ncbi:MAG: hypothetical protein ACKOFJ_05270 [Actinomycetota bacterium]
MIVRPEYSKILVLQSQVVALNLAERRRFPLGIVTFGARRKRASTPEAATEASPKAAAARFASDFTGFGGAGTSNTCCFLITENSWLGPTKDSRLCL